MSLGKYRSFITGILLFLLLFVPFFVFGNAVELRPPIEVEGVGEFLDRIFSFFRSIALFAAPVFFIIGGFYFLTAAGDPGKFQTAKNIFLWTAIGVVVIVLADLFIDVVIGFLS